MKQFSENLRDARRAAGLTQKKAAEKLGASLRSWQGWEQGLNAPNMWSLIDLADLFGIELDELTGRRAKRSTAGPAKIVNCEDCRHLEIINDGKIYAKCRMTDFEFMPFGTDTRAHFCAFGERRQSGA